MGFKIPNNSFSCKVYLKSCIDWPRVGNGTLNHNWSAVYNSLNLDFKLNKVINSLIDSRVLSEVIRQKVNDKAWFKLDCVNAFHNKQNAYCL